MNQPKVFISSTCYDLSQIRTDLFEFISNLGYLPILSEHSSFPIDPDNNTIENCIQNVSSADLFVLILGNRYGYITDTGKSITNTEYQYAKQNGIPIYVFIYKSLISIFPVWKSNKNGDFSSVVDSPKVFEFVEELRENNKSWCFEFERAQEINSTLKIQFSHLFKQSLKLRKRFKATKFPEFYKSLSAAATNIILQKDIAYEQMFFLQTLKDELEKHEHLRFDLEYKILTNCRREISELTELVQWLGINMETIQHNINSLNNLFNNAFKVFLAEPGINSDLKGLYYVACSIARIYKEIVLWSIDLRSTKVEEEYSTLRDILADFPSLCIQQIWSYPLKTIERTQNGIEEYKKDNTLYIRIDATLTLEVPNGHAENFTMELNRLKRLF